MIAGIKSIVAKDDGSKPNVFVEVYLENPASTAFICIDDLPQVSTELAEEWADIMTRAAQIAAIKLEHDLWPPEPEEENEPVEDGEER